MTSPPDWRDAIWQVAGSCPHHACWPRNGPGAAIYRSSNRSVTFRCPDCGLLWTVTVHQAAKAARRILDKQMTYAWITEAHVLVLERWAKAVDDQRGRRPSRARHSARDAR
jgi:hypothetical protein